MSEDRIVTSGTQMVIDPIYEPRPNTAEMGKPVPILYGPGAEETLKRQMEQRKPQTHAVKSWRHLYEPMVAGVKTHDLRLNDRGYQVGDWLRMCEYDPALGVLTGRETFVEITYITGRDEGHNPCAVSSAVLASDYVVLSIKKVL